VTTATKNSSMGVDFYAHSRSLESRACACKNGKQYECLYWLRLWQSINIFEALMGVETTGTKCPVL